MSRYEVAEKQLVVEVFVRDLARSVAFYRALGFELVSEKAGFATVAWDGCELFLDEHPEGVFPAGVTLPNVRIMVPDVDAHWTRAQSLGARVLAPIGDRVYGLRDFTVADPDGFGLRFATRL